MRKEIKIEDVDGRFFTTNQSISKYYIKIKDASKVSVSYKKEWGCSVNGTTNYTNSSALDHFSNDRWTLCDPPKGYEHMVKNHVNDLFIKLL